ncbi:MAG: hypothetical protein GWN55_01705 [Phycisphaerae bacterium]|nr:hypothetical protein [candidate division KSB1 bacterium]NIV00048.1 hypothetical protein [Phycisphaerae bacterium]NIS23051.1 hypothetical protein [candidate division KSB1 bacterium]NIT69904.1 hypothetical protein [candidate division KSB1 bacterium]NIU23569.1 hypothetical protein [candidate division KSB1 bacterium]
MAQNQITATPGVINVIAGNPGLTFSPAQLNAINRGTLVLSNPTGFQPRCITHLRYQEKDEDLQQITFDDGTVFTNSDITNINDFRERLQEAANFGHGVTFCVDKDKKRMFMLNIFPCKCLCKRDEKDDQ